MVETKYDSDYWIIFDTIQFSTPMYGYMGWFNDKTLNNPIPIGNHVFTINFLKSITSIFNLAGYTVSRNMCLDCPYSEAMLGSYSKYNYTPTQNIFFDNEMIGDTATIYIQMTFNSDTGPRVIKNHEMKFIFL